MDDKPARLAVIFPIYNEEQNIADFFDRIKKVREQLDPLGSIRNNPDEPWLLSRSLFYLAVRAIGDYRIVPYMAEFAMLKHCVRGVVLGSHNAAPLPRAESGYAGFSLIGIPYRRVARRYGRTHYNLLGNGRFAVAGILAATTSPLRAIFYAFPLACLLSVLFGVSFALGWIAVDATVVGRCCEWPRPGGRGGLLSVYLAGTYQWL